MKPNGFSVTIDTRFYPQGIAEMFYEVIAAIEEKNASLVSFLSAMCSCRRTTSRLPWRTSSQGTLIADVYYIVAGARFSAVIAQRWEDSGL